MKNRLSHRSARPPDGIEDKNHNGRLDKDETDPTKPSNKLRRSNSGD